MRHDRIVASDDGCRAGISNGLGGESVFEFMIDGTRGIVRFKMESVFTVEEALAFNMQMRTHVDEARRRFRDVKILGDVRDAPVQPLEIAERLDPPSKYLDHSDDRYAIVLSSTLLKFQANRIIDDTRTKVFLLYSEAEDWLIKS